MAGKWSQPISDLSWVWGLLTLEVLCPSGHLSSPWDFHHSLHDPTWISAEEPGSFTSVLSSAKESSANSQPIIPKGRMPDVIFMAVGMSCAPRCRKRERDWAEISVPKSRLPSGKGEIAVYRDAKSLQHPVGDQVN